MMASDWSPGAKQSLPLVCCILAYSYFFLSGKREREGERAKREEKERREEVEPRRMKMRRDKKKIKEK
jgi:hypothetical protein